MSVLEHRPLPPEQWEIAREGDEVLISLWESPAGYRCWRRLRDLPDDRLRLHDLVSAPVDHVQRTPVS